jgi:hypothetical protein
MIGTMATPSKAREGAPVKRSAPAPAPVTGASLRFELSKELQRRTVEVLGAIEEAGDPVELRDELAAVVVALMERGLDGYFMEPLQEAKAGFIAQQSAKLGLSGAQQVMGSVIRKVIGRMDGPQILSVCASIRRFMR